MGGGASFENNDCEWFHIFSYYIISFIFYTTSLPLSSINLPCSSIGFFLFSINLPKLSIKLPCSLIIFPYVSSPSLHTSIITIITIIT